MYMNLMKPNTVVENFEINKKEDKLASITKYFKPYYLNIVLRIVAIGCGCVCSRVQKIFMKATHKSTAHSEVIK